MYFMCSSLTCAHLDLTWDAVSTPLSPRIGVLCSPGSVPAGEVYSYVKALQKDPSANHTAWQTEGKMC